MVPTLGILGLILAAVVLWQIVLKPSGKAPELPPAPARLSLAAASAPSAPSITVEDT